MLHVTAPLQTNEPTGFARGTMIRTPWGRRPVETLVPGDLVWTEDGEQPLRWVRENRVSNLRDPHNAEYRPIRIGTTAPFVREGYMPLMVAPGQRIVLTNAEVSLNLGTRRAATAAINLRHLPAVSSETAEPAIEYFVLHLSGRAVIDANGFWVESRGPASIPDEVAVADQAIFTASGKSDIVHH